MYTNDQFNKEHLALLKASNKKSDAILLKLKTHLDRKGYYENLGQNELRKFKDWIRSKDISYRVQCQHITYLSDAIDQL